MDNKLLWRYYNISHIMKYLWGYIYGYQVENLYVVRKIRKPSEDNWIETQQTSAE